MKKNLLRLGLMSLMLILAFIAKAQTSVIKEKALYTTDDPYTEIGLKAQVVEVPISSMVKNALADSGMDLKSIMKCKNMFALGFICWLFDRPVVLSVTI